MPTFYQDADIQRMLDEFGIPVTISGVTARCLATDADEEIASGSSAVLIGRAVVLKGKSGAFPGAVQGAAATVDYPAAGTVYTVVAVRREGPTGQLTSIVCAKV